MLQTRQLDGSGRVGAEIIDILLSAWGDAAGSEPSADLPVDLGMAWVVGKHFPPPGRWRFFHEGGISPSSPLSISMSP